MSTSVLNLNVGVLGHVDSGKTTLARALSSVASTASFDKNPQSQERGITLDLGFSSFSVTCPDHLKNEPPFEQLQFTLVDCPGHASLIRTIIGGAQIIDIMLLVIDVGKGIQTQTAECLVIGEITCDHLVVVLNKIDLLPSDKRNQALDKVKKRIAKVLEKTKFSGAPMIPIAAGPGADPDSKDTDPLGLDALVDTIVQLSHIPKRSPEGPFVLAVDHCFAIKGQGTVMTGTVVQGSVAVGDAVEIPSANLTKKIKSIQMFKKPVDKVSQGDRVGLCVTQFDPKLLERGAVCSQGHMVHVEAVIATVRKIQYFKGSCSTNAKFHITVMHDTVTAKCSFFGALEHDEKPEAFHDDKEYLYRDELLDDGQSHQFALLQFDRPVILSKESILIGSKLDIDIHANVCRLAFHGTAVVLYTSKQQMTSGLSRLKVYKTKSKEGVVDRMSNEYEVICKDMFKKETKIQLFQNLHVQLSTGETGLIEGSFGQSGKVKVRIPNGLLPRTMEILGSKKKGKKGGDVQEITEAIKVFLNFKRYVYDVKKKIVQT